MVDGFQNLVFMQVHQQVEHMSASDKHSLNYFGACMKHREFSPSTCKLLLVDAA